MSPALARQALPTPVTLSGLAGAYDLVVCDVWGVIYDGRAVIPAALDALRRFREGGGVVVLLSNSPNTVRNVAATLARRGVPREAYDRLVTSGETTRHLLARSGARRVHHIGPETDRDVFAPDGPLVGLALDLVEPDAAEIVVATGLVDDATEEAGVYRARLAALAARGLEFICANPDRVVHVGERIYPCAGALADLYEAAGGRVTWAGKPDPVAYEMARRAAASAASERGLSEPARALAIGDSLVTDMAGAAGARMDALFVATGIHRDEFARHGAVDEAAALAAFGRAGLPAPVGVVPALVW